MGDVQAYENDTYSVIDFILPKSKNENMIFKTCKTSKTRILIEGTWDEIVKSLKEVNYFIFRISAVSFVLRHLKPLKIYLIVFFFFFYFLYFDNSV